MSRQLILLIELGMKLSNCIGTCLITVITLHGVGT